MAPASNSRHPLQTAMNCGALLGLLLALQCSPASATDAALFEQQLGAFLAAGGDLRRALQNVMRGQRRSVQDRGVLLLQEQVGAARGRTMALADELEKEVDREPVQPMATQPPPSAPVVVQSQAALKEEMRKKLNTCRAAGKIALERQAAKCSRLETRHALTKRASTVAMRQCMLSKTRAETQAALTARAAKVSLDMCQAKLKQAMRCVQAAAQQDSYLAGPSSNDYTMQRPGGSYRV